MRFNSPDGARDRVSDVGSLPERRRELSQLQYTDESDGAHVDFGVRGLCELAHIITRTTRWIKRAGLQCA